jgi:hypothetical protein
MSPVVTGENCVRLSNKTPGKQMDAKTILVLAPHTDDAELGCGGTISRFVEEGRKVFVAAFSTAEESLPAGMPADTLKREFFEAMPMLGVPETHLTVFEFPVRRLNYHRQEVLERIVASGRICGRFESLQGYVDHGLRTSMESHQFFCAGFFQSKTPPCRT